MSFIVVVYDGDYPDGKGSSCTLLGSYISRNAARFISEAHKRRNKLEFYPRIMEVDVPPDFPEAQILEQNLKIEKSKINNAKPTKYQKQKNFETKTTE